MNTTWFQCRGNKQLIWIFQTVFFKAKYAINTSEDSNVLSCDICIKTIKSKANFANHDKTYQMVKGKNQLKWDTCNDKVDDKSKLKYHVTKEHIALTTFLKVSNYNFI